AGRQTALQGADHAGRQGLVEAERIADRINELPHLQVRRRADGDRRRRLAHASEAQNGEIVVRRGADQGGGDSFSRREPDGDLSACALDDVVVGDDVARLVPDEAGAGLYASALAVQIREAA